MARRTTETNNSDDSVGTVMGFEGQTYIAVVIAAFVSIMTVTLLLTLTSCKVWTALGTGLLPFILTMAYIFAFVHKRPKGYQFDLFDQWLTRGVFSFSHHNQPEKK